jgi:hypothetical protein
MEAGLACDSNNKGVYEAFWITKQCCGSGSGTQDQGSGAFLTPIPGSGMEKVQSQGIRDPGWRSRILLVSFFGLKILKLFDADPDPGSCQPWIRDEKNWIRDKHPGSATLLLSSTDNERKRLYVQPIRPNQSYYFASVKTTFSLGVYLRMWRAESR